MSAGQVARLLRGKRQHSPTFGWRRSQAACPHCHRPDVCLTMHGAIFNHRHYEESGRCPASGQDWATVHTGIPAAA